MEMNRLLWLKNFDLGADAAEMGFLGRTVGHARLDMVQSTDIREYLGASLPIFQFENYNCDGVDGYFECFYSEIAKQLPLV
ncbi:unnamed protein product [Soboliphyme baturini]|uniref:Myo-inositol-1-phosphate synthase n=1 Tax=Soboliphyme baturini TaxID=241478 RepID=A0A183J3Q8_9BILA|nr:unnamed protein product [Soboliphyme baturini]